MTSTPAAQRAEAARLLHRVVSGRQTTDQAVAPAELTPLTQELVYGSLRHHFSLHRAVHAALHRPLNPKDQELESLLVVGAYQLFHTRVPDHAAISETVEACALLGRPWAKGLVNAVLRSCARSGAPEHSFEHPPWLEAALRSDYPEPEKLMAANNQRAPMSIRINLARTTVAEYLTSLAGAGIASRPAEPGDTDGVPAADEVIWLGPETRVLMTPVASRQLPGYAEGLVSIQDAGAQLVAHLLAPTPGDRLLDACAAPGGKLFHLLERHPGSQWTALEKNSRRLAQLNQEAERLGHRNRYQSVEGDATNRDWWDQQPYQQILVDAPCSGTGTLRRHPDIKLLRRAEEIAPVADLQARLLDNLWGVLAPGGKLLYCTCSILSAENDAVVGRFLQQHADAVSEPLRLATGRGTRHGWQLLPTAPDTDGFYFARMSKART
jgi:16S rRNA (cytosine967-C5)-methyltransferase